MPEYAAWPLEQRKLHAAKEVRSVFQQEISSQTIRKLSIVNLPFPCPFTCAIMTSQLRCRSLTLDLR